MRLYAVIYSPAKDATDVAALNGLAKATSRINALKDAVANAYAQVRLEMQSRPCPYWQAVFLAPEYFFSNQREINDRFFDHTVKRYILQELKNLAHGYPNLLLVPGTLLWKKEAVGDEPSRDDINQRVPVSTNRKLKAHTRIYNAYMSFGSRVDKGWGHSGTADVSSTEYLIHADICRPQIAQNVAYIFLGDQHFKYHKIGNYEEVMGETGNIVFAPGNIAGRFSVGGVKYGLEICMDHAQGVLEKSTGGDVHVQLLVSSYVASTDAGKAAVLLHSSTEKHQKYSDQLHATGVNPIRFKSGSGACLSKDKPKVDGPDWTLWMIDMDEGKLGISNPNTRTIRDTALQTVKH